MEKIIAVIYILFYFIWLKAEQNLLVPKMQMSKPNIGPSVDWLLPQVMNSVHFVFTFHINKPLNKTCEVWKKFVLTVQWLIFFDLLVMGSNP